ncbi:unnamed protein product [Urochloa humidicola]
MGEGGNARAYLVKSLVAGGEPDAEPSKGASPVAAAASPVAAAASERDGAAGTGRESGEPSRVGRLLSGWCLGHAY